VIRTTPLAVISAARGILLRLSRGPLGAARVHRGDVKGLPLRDWALARASKDAYLRSLRPIDRLRLADELRRYALELHPDWPTPEQRAADLAAHVLLSERLERAAASRQR
jgi:hypothetical protein